KATAACEPIAHASGWRVQKCRMSSMVADAADTASAAPISALGVEALCLGPPLGSRTRTTLNQNAIRRRKNMDLPFHNLPHPHKSFLIRPSSAEKTRALKTRFARRAHIYENLNDPHFGKMPTTAC